MWLPSHTKHGGMHAWPCAHPHTHAQGLSGRDRFQCVWEVVYSQTFIWRETVGEKGTALVLHFCQPKRASEMKMSYYGARVTTYRKAYKGKVTLLCNLFAVARTVASNKKHRNGIAHGWQRKRRRQLWLIETSQRLHKRHLRAASPT